MARPEIKCEHCEWTFPCRAVDVAGHSNLFRDVEERCPICGRMTRWSGVVDSRRQFQQLAASAIDAVWSASDPFAAADAAVAALRALGKAPTAEQLESLVRRPGLEWLAGLLPRNRAEARQDLQWLIA